MIGLVPALALAGIDHLMAQQGLSRAVRTGVCATLGYPAATLGFWWAINSAGLYSSFADWVFDRGAVRRDSGRGVFMAGGAVGSGERF